MGTWEDLKADGDWLPGTDDWLGERLCSLVRSLSDRQRRVMYLRYVLGLEQYVAARILRVRRQSVREMEMRILVRARAMLRQPSTSGK